jgi:hypothetical protein
MAQARISDDPATERLYARSDAVPDQHQELLELLRHPDGALARVELVRAGGLAPLAL